MHVSHEIFSERCLQWYKLLINHIILNSKFMLFLLDVKQMTARNEISYSLLVVKMVLITY